MGIYQEPNRPIKFLGGTVLSFNASLGLGSAQESTLTVDVIEDKGNYCENNEQFLPKTGDIIVGDPVIFPPPGYEDLTTFKFGGVLTSWTRQIDSGGEVYKATIVDPRQLLENVIVIVDSYLAGPTINTNYRNVYAHFESSVLAGNCNAFGSSGGVPDRGMPFNKIVQGLAELGGIIYSPTGAVYQVQWSDLTNLSLPAYYKINGPSITLAQLIQEGANALGGEYFCTMDAPNLIRIKFVSYATQPSTITYTLADYIGSASSVQYGEELRNDKTKTMVFGDNVHYMTLSNRLLHFFGEEELASGIFGAVVPTGFSAEGGFIIVKKVTDITKQLYNPLPGTHYDISELDIRAAMASFDLWRERVFNETIPGGFNAAIRNAHKKFVNGTSVSAVLDSIPGGVPEDAKDAAAIDVLVQSKSNRTSYDNAYQLDLEALHDWVSNLGTTYYGKSFLALLGNRICYTRDYANGEMYFTEVPTTAGAWVEPGVPVLGLGEPGLELFRETDGRLGCFAKFSSTDYTPPENPDPYGYNYDSPGYKEDKK